MLLLLLLLQDLNPSFVFWLCVACFLLATFTRAADVYNNYQHLRRLTHGDPSDAAAAAALAAAVGGGSAATTTGELARRSLALRLALMERDFGESDYEVLLALDDDSSLGGGGPGGGPGGGRSRGAPPNVINRIPCYVFPHYEGRLGGKDKDHLVSKATEDLQCSICLESFQPGNEVGERQEYSWGCGRDDNDNGF